MTIDIFVILYGLFSLVILSVTIVVVRGFSQRRARVRFQARKAVLLVTRAKEGAQKEDDRQRDLKQTIAIGETFYSTVASIKSESRLAAFFFGREDEMSFELVAAEGVIKFYIVVPRTQQQYIEQQLLAQYPDANVEEVEDYNIFSPQGAVVGAALSMGSTPFLPLRTYQNLESDPLDAITNAMSKLNDEDGLAVQIVVRPAKQNWGWRGAHMAEEMQQGKKMQKALADARRNWAVKFFFSGIHIFAEMIFRGEKKDAMKNPESYRLTPSEDELVKSLQNKAGKAGFEANLRIIASAAQLPRAKMALDNIVNTMSEFNAVDSPARLKKVKHGNSVVREFIYRTYDDKHFLLLNTEELVSMWHLPLPTTETPNILWLSAKKAPAPVNIPKQGLLLGYNEYRGARTEIRLKREDRRRHMYVIGKSGVGKSVLQENCIIQDIKNGEGVAVIDPHGDLVESILPHIPKERIEDVVLFDPSDAERPLGLNMLDFKTDDQKDFAVQDLVAIFYKLFGQEMIGPMFEHYMRNAMLGLMDDDEDPGTIVEIPRMFTDREYRRGKVKKIRNMVVKNFWEQEYEQSQRGNQSADMLSYVISKIGRFLTNDTMRNIVGQQHSAFDFRDIMDNQKILLVNLSKGKVGEVNSSLLGLVIVSKLQMAALGRASMPAADRKDFYLYIDEFQNFITDSIATILSEARKYLLNLIIAHQYVGQLVQNNDTKIRDAVFGNAGTMMSFRIGVEDAEVMAKEFAPVFNEHDVINIEKYTAYVKLLVDNTGSRAFNMKTYPPQTGGDPKVAEVIRQYSRLRYGRDRRLVEAEIKERSKLDQLGKRDVPPPEPSL